MTKHIINIIGEGYMPPWKLIDILKAEDPEGIYNIGLEAASINPGEKPVRVYWDQVGLGCLSTSYEDNDTYYICNNQGFSFEKVNMHEIRRIIYMKVR